MFFLSENQTSVLFILFILFTLSTLCLDSCPALSLAYLVSCLLYYYLILYSIYSVVYLLTPGLYSIAA